MRNKQQKFERKRVEPVFRPKRELAKRELSEQEVERIVQGQTVELLVSQVNFQL